jgi:hypothetical protein
VEQGVLRGAPATREIQLKLVSDWNQTNDVMMIFWSKKFLTNKFARCFVIPSELPMAMTATMSPEQ